MDDADQPKDERTLDSRKLALIGVGLAVLALCACESTPQIYSNPKHDILQLAQADLR